MGKEKHRAVSMGVKVVHGGAAVRLRGAGLG